MVVDPNWWRANTVPLVASDDREAWLECRRRYFTGSEVATLLDRHEYTKLATILQVKRSGVDDFDGTQDHIRQGILSEQFVAAYTEDCYPGLQLDPCGVLLADPGCTKLAATPDYVTADAAVWGAPGPANVQLKWTKAGTVAPSGAAAPTPAAGWAKTRGYKWGSGEPGTLPSYIWHQVQLEAAVLDVPRSFVVAYHRNAFPGWGSKGNQIRVYRVERNDAVVAELRRAAERTAI